MHIQLTCDQLVLTCIGWTNVKNWLAYQFELNQNKCKWVANKTQVIDFCLCVCFWDGLFQTINKNYKFQKKSFLWSLLISVYCDDCGTFTLREWLYSKWKNTIIIRIKFSFLLCLTCSKLYDWAVFSFVVSADVSEIDVNTFLGPFLDVIRSEDTTGPITGVALSSVNKFLSYGLIGTVLQCTWNSLTTKVL